MNQHRPASAQADVLPVLQTKEETRAFYNKIAKVYDLLAERSEQPVRDAGFAKLNPQPGEHVLEIGFGTGHNLVRIAQRVGPTGKVFGIDLAQAAPGGFERIQRQPDLVVSVCDRARESGLPAGRISLHWSIQDPVRTGTLEAFRQAFAEIANRVGRLAHWEGP